MWLTSLGTAPSGRPWREVRRTWPPFWWVSAWIHVLYCQEFSFTETLSPLERTKTNFHCRQHCKIGNLHCKLCQKIGYWQAVPQNRQLGKHTTKDNHFCWQIIHESTGKETKVSISAEKIAALNSVQVTISILSLRPHAVEIGLYTNRDYWRLCEESNLTTLWYPVMQVKWKIKCSDM